MNKLEQIIPIDAYWAIEEGAQERYLNQIGAVDFAEASRRAEEVFAATKAKRQEGDKLYEQIGSTAVVRLSGPLTKKPTSMSWLIGGASTLQAREAIRSAKADKTVGQLLMVLDSPGGQVDGTEQLANDIRAFGKPTGAFVDGLCCSAALWIATACDSIVASGNTDTVGSIGVITSVTDYSRLYENQGMHVEVVSTGMHKGSGTRGTPLTAPQRAEIQRHIDDLGANFKQAVMAGRGLTEEAINALATGTVWTAERAVDLGLIDSVCSFDDCLSQLSAQAEDPGHPGNQPKTAKAVHDPGTATAASPLEESMNPFKKVLAMLSSNAEARQSAGISEAELAQMEASTRDVDPEVAAQLEVLQAGNREFAQRAESLELATLNTIAGIFADDAIQTQHKADPAERESLIATFVMAAKADGDGGRAVFASGLLVEGANCKAIRDGIAKRQTITVVSGLAGNRIVVPDAKPRAGKESGEINFGALARVAVGLTNGVTIGQGGQK